MPLLSTQPRSAVDNCRNGRPPTGTIAGMPADPAPFPTEIRIAPYRTVLNRGSTGRLIGLDPETAVAIDHLPPPLAEMIDELEATAPTADLLARAVHRGATQDEAENVLRTLLRAGVVVDAARSGRRTARRASSRVLVLGNGPVGCGVATGLARAGVGDIQVLMRGRVGVGDLGTGLVNAHTGRALGDAVVDAVRRLAPNVRCSTTNALSQEVDLVVLADTLAVHPARLAILNADAVPYLPVRLRDGIGVVGPLVLPGRSACFGCLDRHRRDRDALWPTVAAQLIDRPGTGAPVAATAVAALGTAQALLALDEPEMSPPPTLNATLELDVTCGTLVRRRWSPRPDCGCGARLGVTTRTRRAQS